MLNLIFKMETKVKNLVLVSLVTLFLTGCNADKTTGKACLGANNDSLIEGMQEQCKAGDAIATKNPAYFCDFNYTVAYNDYNSAFCIYYGKQKTERTAE